MESKHKFFVAVYTNAVKDYCDDKFFRKLGEVVGDNPVHVVDNTYGDGAAYATRLISLASRFLHNFSVTKLDIDPEPKRTQFLRNVAESVESLRQKFIETSLPYFLIVESDVLPPVDTLKRFTRTIDFLDRIEKDLDKPWGILGGIYYGGFHKMELEGLQRTHHALSGCTVYNRPLLEKYPFRYAPDNLDAFPDAIICYDSGQEFSIWDDHTIKCRHLHAKNGVRASRPL